MFTVEEKINEQLEKISNDNELSSNVYHADCIYFIINDGQILEITDDASCSPRGGWFPTLVSGLKDDEYEYIKGLMEKYSFDDSFFNEAIGYVSSSSDDIKVEKKELMDYFKEKDIDNYDTCWKIISEYNKTNLFNSLSDFVDCVRRFNLNSDSLYYWWDDANDYIDLYENICEFGEEMGSYDDYDEEGWLDILEHISDYKV